MRRRAEVRARVVRIVVMMVERLHDDWVSLDGDLLLELQISFVPMIGADMDLHGLPGRVGPIAKSALKRFLADFVTPTQDMRFQVAFGCSDVDAFRTVPAFVTPGDHNLAQRVVVVAASETVK